MKLFIKIERKLEAILATILIILAPIGCIFAGLAWVYSSIGCIHTTSTIDYITYDIIAPTLLVTGLVGYGNLDTSGYMGYIVVFIQKD